MRLRKQIIHSYVVPTVRATKITGAYYPEKERASLDLFTGEGILAYSFHLDMERQQLRNFRDMLSEMLEDWQ